MNRIFIEVDIDNKHNRWQIESDLDHCKDLGLPKNATKKMGDTFFDKVICNARFEPDLFKYIQAADEIYMSTAIVPIVGGTDLGSPELWDKMMRMAIKNNITGKKIFNARQYKDIQWDNLDMELLDKAFSKNYLYVTSKNYQKWEQVDIDKLIRQLKNK